MDQKSVDQFCTLAPGHLAVAKIQCCAQDVFLIDNLPAILSAKLVS